MVSTEVKRFMIDTVRWFARLLALLVSGPFLYFLLFRSSAVVPDLSWGAPNGMPLFLAWIAVVAGILLAWRWEMLGGIVTVISAVVVALLAYVGCGAAELTTCLVVAVPYVLSGLLLTGCCWAAERLKPSPSDDHATA